VHAAACFEWRPDCWCRIEQFAPRYELILMGYLARRYVGAVASWTATCLVLNPSPRHVAGGEISGESAARMAPGVAVLATHADVA